MHTSPELIKAGRKLLEEFTTKHKLIFQDRGECGFGRECVGLISPNGNYLDYNPLRFGGELGIEDIPELKDDRLRPPRGVEDAYHKHECFAVLAKDENYDEAIRQLAVWVRAVMEIGELEVVEYETGATGLQVVMSGAVGYALKVKEAAHGTNGDGEEEEAESQEADSSEEEASAGAGARAQEETDSR